MQSKIEISNFRKYTGLILHELFFIIMISSVFWLPWYYIFLIFILLRLQDYLLGGCILTWVEFGEFKRQWVAYHFTDKLIKTHKISLKVIALVVDYLFPLSLVILSYFIQK